MTAITFATKRKLLERWLLQTLRVRRQVVADALPWLRRNNRLTHDIQLDLAALHQLPMDGVQHEILQSARVLEFEEVAAREGLAVSGNEDDGGGGVQVPASRDGNDNPASAENEGDRGDDVGKHQAGTTTPRSQR